MKVSQNLSGEFTRLGFLYEMQQSEHPGCWGKSCEGQHLINELRVWKPENPNRRWTFEEGCEDETILQKLTNTPSY